MNPLYCTIIPKTLLRVGLPSAWTLISSGGMAPKNAAVAVKKRQALAPGGQKPAQRGKAPKASEKASSGKQPAKKRTSAKSPADSTAAERSAKQQKTGKKAAHEQPGDPAKQPSKRKAAPAAEADKEPTRKSKTATEASASGKGGGKKGGKDAGKSAAGQGPEAPDGMKPTGLAEHTDYFLVKDEPSDYSIEDLEREGTAEWDGVRNYQARNVMQRMEVGNQVLFYRSGTKHPGLVGLAEVCRDPYPDHTSWDETAKGYDPKSTPENSRWHMVDIKFKRKFDNYVSLDTLKQYKDSELAGLAMFKLSRLSVMALTKEHFDFMMKLVEDAQDAPAE